MCYFSDLGASGLAVHSCDHEHDSCDPYGAVSGDDHRCTTSAIQCKPMHVQQEGDTKDELKHSFHSIPTCTALDASSFQKL